MSEDKEQAGAFDAFDVSSDEEKQSLHSKEESEQEPSDSSSSSSSSAKEESKKKPEKPKKATKSKARSKHDDDLEALLKHCEGLSEKLNSQEICVSNDDDWRKSIDCVGIGFIDDILGDTDADQERLLELCKDASSIILNTPPEYVTFAPKVVQKEYLGAVSYKDGFVHGYPMVHESALKLDMALQRRIFESVKPSDAKIGWTPGPFLFRSDEDLSDGGDFWQRIDASPKGQLKDAPSLHVAALVALTSCFVYFFPHDKEHASKWISRCNTFGNKRMSSILNDAMDRGCGIRVPLDVGAVIVIHQGMPFRIIDRDDCDDPYACKVIPVEWVTPSQEHRRNKAVVSAVTQGKWKLSEFGIKYKHTQLPKTDAGDEFERLKEHFELPSNDYIKTTPFAALKDPYAAKLEALREQHIALLSRVAELDDRLWKQGTELKAAQDWDDLEKKVKPKSKANVGRYENKLKSLTKAVEEAEKQAPNLQSVLDEIDTKLVELDKLIESTPAHYKAFLKQFSTTKRTIERIRDGPSIMKKTKALNLQYGRITKHQNDLVEKKEMDERRAKIAVSKRKREDGNEKGGSDSTISKKKTSAHDALVAEVKTKVYYNPDQELEPENADYDTMQKLHALITSCVKDFSSAVMGLKAYANNESANQAFSKLKQLHREFFALANRDKSAHEGKTYDIAQYRSTYDALYQVHTDVKLLKKKPDAWAGSGSNGKSGPLGRIRITCKYCGKTMTPFMDTNSCRECFVEHDVSKNMEFVKDCVKLAKRKRTKEDENHQDRVDNALARGVDPPEQKYTKVVTNYVKYIDDVEDDLWKYYNELDNGKIKNYKKLCNLLDRARRLLPNVNEDEDWNPDDCGGSDDDEDRYDPDDPENPYGQVVDDSESVGYYGSEEEKPKRKSKKRSRSNGDQLADEVLKQLGRVPVPEIRTELINLYNEKKLNEVRSALKKLPKVAYRIKMKIPGMAAYYPVMYKTEEEASKIAGILDFPTDVEEHRL